MTFKVGKSGNPNGRPKGSLSKRSQLAKLLEPQAEMLVKKAFELALAGDVNALRLCIERIIPRVRHESLDIELPADINLQTLQDVKGKILNAVFDGKIGADEADKIIRLVNEHQIKNDDPSLLIRFDGVDPVEASKIYQKIMQAK